MAMADRPFQRRPRPSPADRGRFVGLILEGPHDWPLRPVAEVFYERDFGGVTTRSALVGAIWQVRDSIAFDVCLRGAQLNDQPLREIRFGVTFGFPLR